MSSGTKWAWEKVERARRAVVDAERRLAKAQEAIAKANAGVLRAERHLRSAKRKPGRAEGQCLGGREGFYVGAGAGDG